MEKEESKLAESKNIIAYLSNIRADALTGFIAGFLIGVMGVFPAAFCSSIHTIASFFLLTAPEGVTNSIGIIGIASTLNMTMRGHAQTPIFFIAPIMQIMLAKLTRTAKIRNFILGIILLS